MSLYVGQIAWTCVYKSMFTFPINTGSMDKKASVESART